MAKFLDETGLQIVWNKCKNTFVSKPLTKTYQNLIASANNVSKASFYFGKIVPSDFNKEWAVRYLITASITGTGTGASNGRSFYEVFITGNQNEVLAYRTLNSIYKTTMLPIKNHAYYMANSVGFATYGHLFGVDLTDSYLPTDGAYKREFIVQIMEVSNCNVTLFDNAVLYENASGTGSTNYSVRETIEASKEGNGLSSIEAIVTSTINAKGSSITVGSSTTFNEAVNLKKATTIGTNSTSASLKVYGTGEITGNTSVGGTLTSTGKATLNGGADVNGNLAVSGSTTNTGSLTVTGAATVNNDLKTQAIYPTANNQYDLGKSNAQYNNAYLNIVNVGTKIVSGSQNYIFPSSKGGTFAMTSDIKTYTNGSGIKLNGDVFSLNTDFVTSGKNYKVQVDATSGGAYVNVPWVGTTVKSLNTNNTTAQTANASEAIEGSGTINLHKVSKTGSYNDLNDKPTIPTSMSSSNITGGYLNTHPENGPTLIPFINNDIAFLLKRGGSVIIKYDNVIKTGFDVSAFFDGSPTYWGMNPTTEGVTTIIFEITLHKTFSWTNIIYIDFGAGGWRAKNITLEVMNSNYADDVWTQKGSVSNYGSGHYMVTVGHTPVGASNAGGGFNKIRYTLSNWNSPTNFRIAQIGIYNYGSASLREPYMSRGIDDYVFRNITPNGNNTYSLGDSTHKWKEIYGALKGNADTATTASDSDKLGGQLPAYYAKASDVTAIQNILNGTDATKIDTINEVYNFLDEFNSTTDLITLLNGKVDKNTAITAGTHTKITYDSKGLVTGGSDLTASDIPNLSSTYSVVGHSHTSFNKLVLNPTNNPTADSYNEGVRINKSTNNWATIAMGGDTNSTSGTGSGVWLVGRRGQSGSKSGATGDFTIEHNGSTGTGLTLYANGNKPRWNNNVLAYVSDIPTKVSDLTNDSNYLTGITSSMVTTALGYTPYNATNPNGYTTNTGTVTSVATSGTGLSGGTITTSGTITLDSSSAGNAAANKVVLRNATGSIQSEKIAISSGATTKATMQYNTTDDCIDFVFA